MNKFLANSLLQQTFRDFQSIKISLAIFKENMNKTLIQYEIIPVKKESSIINDPIKYISI